LVTIHANAKINLTLDILGKRADGYHEVAMVMQAVGLYDTLCLEQTAGGIGLTIDLPGLAADETNLAWKAARLIMDTCSIRSGVHIRLTKRIPVAAGLAGGSADAAAVLRGMSELYDLKLSEAELCDMGAKLGSDVPFCILGGTMLATGRGEVLQRLPDLSECHVVLAKPPLFVSTAWAYKEYDRLRAVRHPDNEAMQRQIAAGDLKGVSRLLCNVLESVTIKKHKEILSYKKLMDESGAMASMMSGSGPTVFALAENRKQADIIADAVQRTTNAAVFVVKTISRN
jgi:4-diphosphocytidyl-2-C-methyl-D-erythritol kinase